METSCHVRNNMKMYTYVEEKRMWAGHVHSKKHPEEETDSALLGFGSDADARQVVCDKHHKQ